MLGPIALHPKKLSLGFSTWGIQSGVYRFSRDSSDETDPAPQRHTCPISVCKDVYTPNRVYRIYTEEHYLTVWGRPRGLAINAVRTNGFAEAWPNECCSEEERILRD